MMIDRLTSTRESVPSLGHAVVGHLTRLDATNTNFKHDKLEGSPFDTSIEASRLAHYYSTSFLAERGELTIVSH
jgi:phosphoribosyl 1,2-cyclic phosphodiesterase